MGGGESPEMPLPSPQAERPGRNVWPGKEELLMSRLSKNIIRAAKSMVAHTLCPFREGRSLSWTLTLGEPEGAVTLPPSQLFFSSAPGSSIPGAGGSLTPVSG